MLLTKRATAAIDADFPFSFGLILRGGHFHYFSITLDDLTPRISSRDSLDKSYKCRLSLNARHYRHILRLFTMLTLYFIMLKRRLIISLF